MSKMWEEMQRKRSEYGLEFLRKIEEIEPIIKDEKTRKEIITRMFIDWFSIIEDYEDGSCAQVFWDDKHNCWFDVSLNHEKLRKLMKE